MKIQIPLALAELAAGSPGIALFGQDAKIVDPATWLPIALDATKELLEATKRRE